LEAYRPATAKAESFWRRCSSPWIRRSAQGDAATQVAQLLNGKGADLHSAMIAVEKADLSFQLMMQVRNKIVQAYQQISSMQF